MPERNSSLGTWIKRFLMEYLPTERNLAINTLKSYRDGLTLLLPFVAERCSKAVERLAVEDLSAERVTAFLGHLEQERGCSVQTRNLRLTAVRSFARLRRGARRGTCRMGRQHPRHSAQENGATPDHLAAGGEHGRHDRGAGQAHRSRTGRARPSSCFSTTPGREPPRRRDCRWKMCISRNAPGKTARATIHGKGGKIRITPLWTSTAKALAALSRDRPARLRERLLEPASQTLYPAWNHRTRGACRSPRAGTPRAKDHAALPAPQLRLFTCFAPASISTPFVLGSVTYRSQPPTSTPRSISKRRKRR